MLVQQRDDFRNRVITDHRVGVDGANIEAGVALIAIRRVEVDLAIDQRQRVNVTGRDAVAAVIALADRVRIVAGLAIEVAALQEQDQSITGPVDARKVEYLTDRTRGGVHYQ